MKYIFYAYCISWSLLLAFALGEYIACNVSKTNFFSKWWRKHICADAPNDLDF